LSGGALRLGCEDGATVASRGRVLATLPAKAREARPPRAPQLPQRRHTSHLVPRNRPQRGRYGDSTGTRHPQAECDPRCSGGAVGPAAVSSELCPRDDPTEALVMLLRLRLFLGCGCTRPTLWKEGIRVG